MRSLLFSLLVAIGVTASAVTPYIPINVDFEAEGSQFVIPGKVLNTPIVRAFTFQGTNVWNPTGYNAYLSFGADANVTNMVVITGTCYSTYIDFQIKSNSFARPVERWYCSVMCTLPIDAGVYSIGKGILNIEQAPEVNANAVFFYTRAINGSEYGPFTGDFTNWPFALKGDYGGYVSFSTFNSSNAVIQAQVTANLASANSTSTVFQALHNAQALSNALYWNRIMSNETFRLVTQPATNLSFQTQITSNQNQITDDKTAQGNTNASLQSQITNNLANQGNTNSGFESRLAANDTFRTTTQPAINAALQTQITANFTNQNASNLNFQTQITLNLTNQNATNVVLQTQITSNLTLANNTAAVFQAAITNLRNYTNYAYQSYSWGNWSATMLATSNYIGTVSSALHNADTTLQTNINILSNYTANSDTTLNEAIINVSNVLNTAITALEGGGFLRYFARTNSSETVEVVASSASVVCSRTNSTFYFTIPTNSILLSAKIRLDGSYTSAGVIYLNMGTNDMNNSGTTTDWNPIANCFREDTLAAVTLTCRPYVTTPSMIAVSGLGTSGGVIYNCRFNW